MTQDFERLRQENAALMVKKEELEKGLKQEHSKIEEIQNLVLKFKLLNDSLKQKYEGVREINTELESSNSTLIIENEVLKKNNNELNLKVEKLYLENDIIAARLKESQAKLCLKDQEYYVQQITELEDIIKEHEAIIKKLSKENMQLKHSSSITNDSQIQIVQAQNTSESNQRVKSQPGDKPKDIPIQELKLNSSQFQNTLGEETPAFKDHNLDMENYFPRVTEDKGLVTLIQKKGDLESKKKNIEEILVEVNKDLMQSIEKCKDLNRNLIDNQPQGPELQRNNELIQLLEMILNENKQREKQKIADTLKDRIKERDPKDDTIAFDSARTTTRQLKFGSDAEFVLRQIEGNHSGEESFGQESGRSQQLQQQQRVRRSQTRTDLGSRVVSQEFKIRKFKEYFQKLSSELENKNNTVELLKHSLKVRMEKTNEQIEELKQKNERAILEVEKRFDAIEKSLKEHLLSLVQEAARFKKVNLTTKGAEDARNIFLEIKRILVEALEENASLIAKKKPSSQGKNETTLDRLRLELFIANNELEKKRIEIENIEKAVSDYSEEKKEIMKVFDQALRVRTVLTPIKEEQLKEVLKVDPSTKALVNNAIFIKDAMIYHLFLSDYIFGEPEMPIPWANKPEKTNQSIPQEIEEQIQSLKDQLKAKEAEILSQAKTWSSVISKIDKKLKKLIYLGKQEGGQSLQLEKTPSEAHDSPRGAKQTDDKAFAENLAQKLQIIETIIQNSNEIKEKYAKVIESKELGALTHRDDSKSSIIVDEQSPGQLPQLKVQKRQMSFRDPESSSAEEAKEKNQENKIPSLEVISSRQEYNQYGSPPLSTVLSLSSQEESPGLKAKMNPTGSLKIQKPINERDSPTSSKQKITRKGAKRDTSPDKSFEITKLQEDMNKLKSLYEQERFINDQISLQLQDYQSIAEKHKIQEELLKKQITELMNRLKSATANAFEREQFKQMFSKVIDGMFERSKDVIDAIKIIMSILGFTQEERDKFDSKLKQSGKKSAFSQLL